MAAAAPASEDTLLNTVLGGITEMHALLPDSMYLVHFYYIF